MLGRPGSAEPRAPFCSAPLRSARCGSAPAAAGGRAPTPRRPVRAAGARARRWMRRALRRRMPPERRCPPRFGSARLGRKVALPGPPAVPASRVPRARRRPALLPPGRSVPAAAPAAPLNYKSRQPPRERAGAGGARGMLGVVGWERPGKEPGEAKMYLIKVILIKIKNF